MQKEPNCRTLVHCKQTILPACDKTKNRMKITQLREKDGNLTLSTTDLDTFLQKIKTETKTQPVSTFRQQLRYCLPGKRCNEADRLPKVLPQPNSARRTVSAR